jgi:hypothetical protein
MKAKYVFYLSVAVFFLTGFLSMSFAQSSQCIIADKQGSLVTVTCPGEGTKVISMDGSADIYKTGDKVTIPNQTTERGRDVGRKGR